LYFTSIVTLENEIRVNLKNLGNAAISFTINSNFQLMKCSDRCEIIAEEELKWIDEHTFSLIDKNIHIFRIFI
jgi:hypothetical protein